MICYEILLVQGT